MSPRWIWYSSSVGNSYGGSNFQSKCDIRNCSCYRSVKLLEHGMKVVERVLKKAL